MLRRRVSSDDVQIVGDDAPISLDSSLSFVDLTHESPSVVPLSGQQTRLQLLAADRNHEIVDLTCLDISPVVLDPAPTRRRNSRQSRRGVTGAQSSRRHNPYSSSSSSSEIMIASDEENEVQFLMPVSTSASNVLPRCESVSGNAAASGDVSSPGRKQVKCPVCMENETQILASNLHLMSTICGHIFCSSCIRSSIQTQHRCPSCRKRLTKRQVHPIYL